MDEIDRFLREDLGQKGDITSDALFKKERAEAVIIAKQDCLIAGLSEAQHVFKKTGASTRLLSQDGTAVKMGGTVMKIRGPLRSILKGERLALNIIGRMSGIASETQKLVVMCKKINPKVAIAGTRKTTPGFRYFEKKAIILGGGDPHRYGLYDAVLIKDNHLKKIGSVKKAITRIRQMLPDVAVEIEVENEMDALAAARLNVQCIMLDNLPPNIGEKIARKIRDINPGILIEVSGGITEKNIVKYASFADRISLGYLTHSIKNKDFSLEILR
ncbi:MAG: carboxylating nicotinate-nucleotide diphosphorylase [Candidatus Thermoplasmatota archaeon]|nr:carboxylating nicotinate-nucleotide diphosphorylase [Candidatus Thermoplasmatota archaeon]